MAVTPCRSSIVLAVVTLCGWASVCRGETGVTANEILIGSCAPMKQDLGIVEKIGATTYLDYVNNELGGVHGRKIRASFIDDDFTAEGAVRCYERHKRDGVFALAFLASGAETVELIKLATADKVPILPFANGAPYMYHPFKRYVITTRPDYTQEAYAVAEALYTKLRAKRLGVIYMSDGLGFAGLEGAKQAAAARRTDLAAASSFLRDAADISGVVQAVRQAKPDAVLIIGNYRQAAKILMFAKKSGWKTTFALVTSREAVVSEAGDAAEGLIMALLYPHPSRTDLPTVALFRQLMAKEHPDVEPDVKMLEGFTHAVLVVKALQAVGRDLTREKVIDAFESMKGVDIGLGQDYTVTFSSTNHQGFKHVDFSVVRNGRSVPVTDWKPLRR